ncbi:hypothetical protein ACLKA7_005002 [Drosophila subpalustris]
MMMRFGDIEKNFIYAESTILDPRFKSRGFKNEDNFKDAVQNLKIKLQSVIVADPEDAEEMDIPHGPVDKPSFWDAYDSEFRSGKTSQSKPGQYTFGVHEESPGYGPQLHKRGPGGCVSSLGRLGRPAKFRGPKSCQTVATLLADSC